MPPLWIRVAFVGVLAAPAGTGDVKDDTFLLGAGAVIDSTADTLDDALVADGDVDTVESVAASDASWSGAVPVEFAVDDNLALDCDGTPCTRAWTARLTLDDIVLHDGGRAGETARFWHLATRDAASLRARGFVQDRTATVTVTYNADWDDFSGHVRVTGTVDGAASAYDYGWTD